MTDRELLEKAAKAVGLAVEFDEGDVNGYWPLGRDPDGDVIAWWNPLKDDGDALRLAVKLYLWEAVRMAHRDVSDSVDIYAATRRAIVRAAAEIGKAMP